MKAVKHKIIGIVLFSLVLFGLTTSPLRLFAHTKNGLSFFPDSSALRQKYWLGFINAAPPLDRWMPIRVSSEGEAFLLSVEKSGGYEYALVTSLVTANAKPQLSSRGSWIFKREPGTGAIIQAKVFLQNDPGTYIRLYPYEDRCRMDVIVYGAALNLDVIVPVPFPRAATSRIEDIREWTESTVDWELFSPAPGLYLEARDFASKIEKKLPTLAYADDGAISAEGRPVLIATGQAQTIPVGLNCSGFALWVIDGLYRPYTGSLLDPLAMAKRHDNMRINSASRPVETQLDPWFGLDWTRNLGMAMKIALQPDSAPTLRSQDVTISPFSFTEGVSKSTLNGSPTYLPYPGYQMDLGYETPGLKGLLYVLAIKEPGYFYLASVSGKTGGVLAGLSRHYHVAIFIPYFDEAGLFQVATFESDARTSIDAVIRRAPHDFVHLVRIPLGGQFVPPPLRKG